MTDRGDLPTNRPRTRSRAMVLVILGVVLLMPPAATIFHLENKVLGIPVTLIYLFTVWAILILGAYVLRRGLDTGSMEDDA